MDNWDFAMEVEMVWHLLRPGSISRAVLMRPQEKHLITVQRKREMSKLLSQELKSCKIFLYSVKIREFTATFLNTY